MRGSDQSQERATSGEGRWAGRRGGEGRKPTGHRATGKCQDFQKLQMLPRGQWDRSHGMPMGVSNGVAGTTESYAVQMESGASRELAECMAGVSMSSPHKLGCEGK